ncbi:hypothetical protein ACK4CO_18110, partial [Enterococcus gallinarum]
IIGNPSLNHRYRKGFYSLFKTLQQNRIFLFPSGNGKYRRKKIIADLARDYINQEMCIFFDSSSTCQYLCQLIQGMPNMVCVTNGLRNAFILNEDQSLRTRVYMLGGELKPGAASITSFTDTNSLTEQFVYDFSFFSCRGIDLDGVY